MIDLMPQDEFDHRLEAQQKVYKEFERKPPALEFGSGGQTYNINGNPISKSCLAKPGSKRGAKQCHFGEKPSVVINEIPYGSDDRYLLSKEKNEAEVDTNGKAKQCHFNEVPETNDFVHTVVELVKEEEKKQARRENPENEYVELQLDSLPSKTRELLAQARVNRLHVHTGSEEPVPQEGEELLMKIAILDDGRYIILHDEDSPSSSEDEEDSFSSSEDEKDSSLSSEDEEYGNRKAKICRFNEVPETNEFAQNVVELVKEEERKQASRESPENENVQLELDSLPPKTRELFAQARVNRLHLHKGSDKPEPQEGEKLFMQIAILDDGQYVVLDEEGSTLSSEDYDEEYANGKPEQCRFNAEFEEDSFSSSEDEDVNGKAKQCCFGEVPQKLDEGKEDEDDFYDAEEYLDSEDDEEYEDCREYEEASKNRTKYGTGKV